MFFFLECCFVAAGVDGCVLISIDAETKQVSAGTMSVSSSEHTSVSFRLDHPGTDLFLPDFGRQGATAVVLLIEVQWCVFQCLWVQDWSRFLLLVQMIMTLRCRLVDHG